MPETTDNQDRKKRELSTFVRALSEPLSKHGWPSWLVYIFGVIGVIYILNPTLGVLEFIPDNLPVIGNLDESVAVMLILAGIVEALEGKKYRKEKASQEIASQPTDGDEPAP
jgi:uncharacterized membrane protein YkvA (DUF1232 family)